jgi:hypothetical protein
MISEVICNLGLVCMIMGSMTQQTQWSRLVVVGGHSALRRIFFPDHSPLHLRVHHLGSQICRRLLLCPRLPLDIRQVLHIPLSQFRFIRADSHPRPIPSRVPTYTDLGVVGS